MSCLRSPFSTLAARRFWRETVTIGRRNVGGPHVTDRGAFLAEPSSLVLVGVQQIQVAVGRDSSVCRRPHGGIK